MSKSLKPFPAKTPEQALQSLMTLCAKTERSSGDARRLMARWQVDPARREEVLNKLISSRFIDDRRYAAAYVREKSKINGWGAHKIRTMLITKGIARETIDEALEQIDPEATQDKLRELLQRKARTISALHPRQLREKLMRYGLGRGFDYERVAKSVNELIRHEDEE